MPSSMTHTYFGMDVFHKLPQKYQDKITYQLEYFKLFCQGSDPFMFYHFLIGKKAKQYGEIQKRMHQENTQNFFINTIQYIHKHKLLNDETVMSFLYGYICHYYLDLYTHPFIFYKSGVFLKNDKNTYKYNGIHQEIEYMIDLYFIQKREKIKPEKFKVHQEIFQVTSFSPNLTKIINHTIEKTYQIPKITSKYLKSIWYMKNFFRYINYDPYGIKQKIYQFIDKISPDGTIRLQELSYHNSYKNKLHYLNLTHQNWCYPWDNTKNFSTSFLDLYNQAMKEAINTIQVVTNLLEKNNLNILELKKYFPDLSYTTGKKCQEKLNFQYFDF